MKDDTAQDVIERLVRIETKLDNYEALREKADAAKDVADRKSTRLNSSHFLLSRMPSSA